MRADEEVVALEGADAVGDTLDSSAGSIIIVTKLLDY
jgi:hypothetical protein